MKPNLSVFDNSWYHAGRSIFVQAAWFFLGLPLMRCAVLPGSGVRAHVLRLFGSMLGKGVVIKPGVRVKYPWLLTVGDHCWIGEDVWIDNIALVNLGSNVCISQGAYLCTGNHDWSDPAFALKPKPIELRDGSWVAARSVICPGVTVGECAIAAAGSVVTNSIPAYEIYSGNPARYLRKRVFAG